MTDPYIWVSPGRLSGKPCLGGHRLNTDLVADHYATSGMDEVCRAYVIERADVLICCWFEAEHGKRRFRRWRPWVHQHFEAMWHGNWDDVPEPPR